MGTDYVIECEKCGKSEHAISAQAWGWWMPSTESNANPLLLFLKEHILECDGMLYLIDDQNKKEYREEEVVHKRSDLFLEGKIKSLIKKIRKSETEKIDHLENRLFQLDKDVGILRIQNLRILAEKRGAMIDQNKCISEMEKEDE